MPDPARPTHPETAPNADLFEAAMAKIKANVELLLGRTVAIEPGDRSLVDAATLGKRIPAPSLVLGVQASGAVNAALHCVIPQPLALAMACIAGLRPDDSTAERLASGAALTGEERAGLREVGAFVVAALGDFAKETTGGRIVLAPVEPRFLEAGGAPVPFGEDLCVVLESRATLAPAPPSVLMLVVPQALATAWTRPGPPPPSVFGAAPEAPKKKPAPAHVARTPPARAPVPPAAARASRPGVWLAGSAGFAKTVEAAAGASLGVRTFASLADLVSAGAACDPPSLVLVEVPAGKEPELETIAALRHHPRFASRAIMVALGEPLRRHVVRCGSLGIVDVIPGTLDAKRLAERLFARANPLPRRTA